MSESPMPRLPMSANKRHTHTIILKKRHFTASFFCTHKYLPTQKRLKTHKQLIINSKTHSKEKQTLVVWGNINPKTHTLTQLLIHYLCFESHLKTHIC